MWEGGSEEVPELGVLPKNERLLYHFEAGWCGPTDLARAEDMAPSKMAGTRAISPRVRCRVGRVLTISKVHGILLGDLPDWFTLQSD